jgi:hypothetical protein
MSSRDKITTATSSASLYDNVNSGSTGAVAKGIKSTDSLKLKDKQQQSETCQTTPKTVNVAIGTNNVGSQVRRPFACRSPRSFGFADSKGSTGYRATLILALTIAPSKRCRAICHAHYADQFDGRAGPEGGTLPAALRYS